jgi:hypothetical protein
MSKLFEQFKNPPREYGIYPIIHGGISQPESNIERIDSGNYAGVVANVPYGKDYPEDAAEWKATEDGFRKYIERNMKLWIYDEKGYPSGSAGGVVLDRNPEYESVGLVCYDYWKTLEGPSPYRADTPDGKLFKALLVPLDGGEAVDITDTVNERGTLYFEIPKGAYRLLTLSIRNLFDGTHAAHSYSEPRRYIDLFSREATTAFINVTHDKYAEILKDEFGKGIRAFFTDEPSLIGWGIPATTYPYLSWSPKFPELFETCYGYGIEKAVVAALNGSGPEFIKRRCDFWEFVSSELSENFFGTIQDWCHKNGLASSGHMLCEEDLIWHVFCYGSYFKCAKRFDWPGIDQLESEPTRLMSDKCIPIARLAASTADVFGLKETFTEASDHSSRCENRQISIEWIRASMNWHYAQGINNITSYYNFGYFSTEQIRDLNQYVSRLGVMLREGVRDSRVAVLYPENAIWSAFTPTAAPFSGNQSEKAIKIKDTFIKVSWELLHRQIDFDYIDEGVINDGEVNDGILSFLSRRYECIVLPTANVMCAKTIAKIIDFMKSGGKVIAIGGIPSIARETGLVGNFNALLAPFCGKDGNLVIVEVESDWKLPNTTALPRTIIVEPSDYHSVLTGAAGNISGSDGVVLSPNILSHIRKDGDKLIVFVCNMSGTTYNGVIKVENGVSCQIADLETGDVTNCVSSATNGRLITALNLKPYDACLYIVETK